MNKRDNHWRNQWGFYEHVKIDDLVIQMDSNRNIMEDKRIQTLRLHDDGNWWNGSGYAYHYVNEKREVIISDSSSQFN